MALVLPLSRSVSRTTISTMRVERYDSVVLWPGAVNPVGDPDLYNGLRASSKVVILRHLFIRSDRYSMFGVCYVICPCHAQSSKCMQIYTVNACWAKQTPRSYHQDCRQLRKPPFPNTSLRTQQIQMRCITTLLDELVALGGSSSKLISSLLETLHAPSPTLHVQP